MSCPENLAAILTSPPYVVHQLVLQGMGRFPQSRAIQTETCRTIATLCSRGAWVAAKCVEAGDRAPETNVVPQAAPRDFHPTQRRCGACL